MIKGIGSWRYCMVILVLFVSIEVHGQSETYALSFPEDEFTEDAILDLSYLNELEAGENGFIQLSEDGESFVNGNGEIMRFWAIGGGDATSRDAFRVMSDEQIAYFAKFLAKKGVNMIRYHGGIHSKTNDLFEVDTEEVKDIWRLVAAMKKEGIYTTISPFWAGHVDEMPAAWELGDYKGEVKPWGLMYFNDRFKNAYKTWVEFLYTESNPYTGMALKDDPAVAIIQIKNEDGVFFWTIQDVKPTLKANMENQFYNWLIDKYGTIDAAYNAWSNEIHADDDVAQSRMGLYIIWHATQDQTGAMQARLTDQMEFYANVQRSFYQEIYDHYRSLGCKQIINGNNWKTANPLRLFDLERWTNTVGEVMAVNRYVSPQHIGDNSGWRIEPGHKYVGNSVLKTPHKFPINVKQVEGRAFIVSESAWNLPHKYQAEGPFLIASYMSLTGFDAYYWFSPSSYTFDALPYWDFAQVNGQMPMFRWTVSTPGQIGMFPANALMFREGMIARGDIMIHEERTLKSLYERKIPIIGEENSFDPNRDDYSNTGGAGETEIAPIAYLTGPVQVKYDGEPANTYVSEDLENLLDFQKKKITSVTGELRWDYQNGMVTLDAPSAKGICGFPGTKQNFQLTDVSIETSNDYVVVNVVAMDEKAINLSEKILIQIGTIYRPNKWHEVQASFELGEETVNGFEIRDVGEMPWMAQNSEVSVTINNPNIQSARVLDINGYESREIFVQTNETSDEKVIIMPEDAMYIVADTRPANVLGIEEIRGKIRIYPNPNNGQLTVENSDEYLTYDKLEILDLSGKVLREFRDTKDQYNLKLPSGTYLVLLRKNEQLVLSKKIVIGD